MKCAVITPIGPGHSDLYREMKKSVEEAFKNSRGEFSSIELVSIDDTQAKLGRSTARNNGVKKASKLGCDWIFFLDADDLMLPNAFKDVSPYLASHDGIWGLISELSPDATKANIRLPQLPHINTIEELVLHDPFITLQMGHFIKTEIALTVPFDKDMDTGEDFKYYLDVWRKNKCIKQNKIFFANRRGSHSTGPRSADGHQWRVQVEALLAKEKQRINNQGRLKKSNEIIAGCSISIATLVKDMADISIDQCIELSKTYPINDDISLELEGKSISFHCNNDDVLLLNNFWRKSSTLMQVLTSIKELSQSRVVYNIGSYTGVFDIVMAAISNASVVSFEPNNWAYERCKKNIKLNNLGEYIKCFKALPASTSAPVEWSVKEQSENMPIVINAARDRDSIDRGIDSVDIISIVDDGDTAPPDLILLSKGMPAASILRSLRPLIAQFTPDIFIEVEPRSGLATGLLLEAIFPEGCSYVTMEVDLLSGEISPALGAVSSEGAKWFLLRSL
ncbi:glycosyltransferase [Oceanicoccus sp. KOV_DT_Chl]|uniref:glycosyltransferase n=1 Tax=Oceanicoccus sp. KOV_DT_Chl TaxID=1904639 RepID=UPI000C7C98FD|nr:glycosyltransferase [Oceanicoccus sp. KOV_DT_Chl]